MLFTPDPRFSSECTSPPAQNPRGFCNKKSFFGARVKTPSSPRRTKRENLTASLRGSTLISATAIAKCCAQSLETLAKPFQVTLTPALSQRERESCWRFLT